MTAVEPTPHEGAVVILIARNQPPYRALPASVDEDGLVMTEWEVTPEEALKLFAGGRIRIWLAGTDIHIGRPFTPIFLEATDPLPGVAKES